MISKRKVVFGTFWTSISALVKAAIQIFRLSILTRFLTPSDFGLVAIVTLIIGFTRIFADLGVSVSLYSENKITRRQFSSLYWMGLILSSSLYILLLLFAPLISSFYGMTILNNLIPLMGLEMIFSMVGMQFRVLKEKELQFKELAIIDIIALTGSLLLAFILAINGYGVYSLVISGISASAISSLIIIATTYKMLPLLFCLDLKGNKKFYKIGFYQLGTQILDYVASQIDIILIGKLMSTEDLGSYNLVKQLVQRIYGFVNPIITKVSVPILAKIDSNTDLLKTRYLQMLQIVSFVNFGMYGLVAVLAQEVLRFLYGFQYVDSAFILQLLCYWGGFSAIGNAVFTLVIIKGRTELGLTRTFLRMLISPLFVFAGSFFGLPGIALAQVLYSTVFFIGNWLFLIRRITKSITLKDYAKVVLPVAIFTFLAVLMFNGVRMILLKPYSFFELFVMVFLFTAGYLLYNMKNLRAFIVMFRKSQ